MLSITVNNMKRFIVLLLILITLVCGIGFVAYKFELLPEEVTSMLSMSDDSELPQQFVFKIDNQEMRLGMSLDKFNTATQNKLSDVLDAESISKQECMTILGGEDVSCLMFDTPMYVTAFFDEIGLAHVQAKYSDELTYEEMITKLASFVSGSAIKRFVGLGNGVEVLTWVNEDGTAVILCDVFKMVYIVDDTKVKYISEEDIIPPEPEIETISLAEYVKRDDLSIPLVMEIEQRQSGNKVYTFPKVETDEDLSSNNPDVIQIGEFEIRLSELYGFEPMEFVEKLNQTIPIKEVVYFKGYKFDETYEELRVSVPNKLGLSYEYLTQSLMNARESELGFIVQYVFDAGLMSPKYDSLTYTVEIDGSTYEPYEAVLELNVYNTRNEVYLLFEDEKLRVSAVDNGDKLTKFKTLLSYKSVFKEKEVVQIDNSDTFEKVGLSEINKNKYPLLITSAGPDNITGEEVIETSPDTMIFGDMEVAMHTFKSYRPVDFLEELNKMFPLEHIYLGSQTQSVFSEVYGSKNLVSEYFAAVLANAPKDKINTKIRFVFNVGLVHPNDAFFVDVNVDGTQMLVTSMNMSIYLNSIDDNVWFKYKNENLLVKLFDKGTKATTIVFRAKQYY